VKPQLMQVLHRTCRSLLGASQFKRALRLNDKRRVRSENVIAGLELRCDTVRWTLIRRRDDKR